MKRAREEDPLEARDLVFGSKIGQKILSYLNSEALNRVLFCNRVLSRAVLRYKRETWIYCIPCTGPWPEEQTRLVKRYKRVSLCGPEFTGIIESCLSLEVMPGSGPVQVPDPVTEVHFYGNQEVLLPSALELLDIHNNWKGTSPFPQGLKRLESTVPIEDLKQLVPNSIECMVVCQVMYPFPENLLTLELHSSCMGHLVLPARLTKLVLDPHFLYIGSLNLPETLTHLELHDRHVHPLDNLPRGVTYLKFGAQSLFDQPLDRLPSSIRTLKLGKHFNKPLANLPKDLTCLEIGTRLTYSCFCQPLDKLPESLTRLVLRLTQNHTAIYKPYPHSLNSLPRRLRTLIIDMDSWEIEESLTNLPPKLETFATDSYTGSHTNLPRTLIRLRLSGPYNRIPEGLPDSIRKLVLTGWFNQPLPRLPKALQYLRLGYHFDQYVPGGPNGPTELVLMNWMFTSIIDLTAFNKMSLPVQSGSMILRKQLGLGVQDPPEKGYLCVEKGPDGWEMVGFKNSVDFPLDV